MSVRYLREKILVTAIYLAFVAVLYLLRVPCFFLRLFTYPCPGCGMTRAYIALLQGDLFNAFHSHPMFWAVPLIYLFILFDGRLFRNKKLNAAILFLLGFGFLLTWLWRIIL